jgi:hypothetical protein
MDLFSSNVFICLGIMRSFWPWAVSGFSEALSDETDQAITARMIARITLRFAEIRTHTSLGEFTTLCYHRDWNLCSWPRQNAWFECRAGICLEISRQTQQFQQIEAHNDERLFTTVCFIYDNDQSLGRVSDQEVSRTGYSSEGEVSNWLHFSARSSGIWPLSQIW